MPTTSARDILANNWNKKIPVDLISIAAGLGVGVQADPLNSTISGHYLPQGGYNGSPLITYNPFEHPVRQRFTIAHELGHHALGHGERDRDTPESFYSGVHDPIEQAANQFAAEILMPADTVHMLIRTRGISDVETLSSLFWVSRAAMKYRLRNLGYVVG